MLCVCVCQRGVDVFSQKCRLGTKRSPFSPRPAACLILSDRALGRGVLAGPAAIAATAVFGAQGRAHRSSPAEEKEPSPGIIKFHIVHTTTNKI